VLPHPDLAVTGTVRFAAASWSLDGARGGQAHLWGSKHASRWTWAHANDLRSLDGEPRPGAYVDGVSVYVPRFGRRAGPEHAGRRALRGRRLPLHEPAAASPATPAASA
jgi:hypothetical protein